MPRVPVALSSLRLNDAPWSPTLQDVPLFLAMACGNRRVPVLLFSPADWLSVPSETQGNGLQGQDSSHPAHQRHEQHQDTQAEVDRDP